MKILRSVPIEILKYFYLFHLNCVINAFYTNKNRKENLETDVPLEPSVWPSNDFLTSTQVKKTTESPYKYSSADEFKFITRGAQIDRLRVLFSPCVYTHVCERGNNRTRKMKFSSFLLALPSSLLEMWRVSFFRMFDFEVVDFYSIRIGKFSVDKYFCEMSRIYTEYEESFGDLSSVIRLNGSNSRPPSKSFSL